MTDLPAEFRDLLAAIGPPDQEAMAAARARQDDLTKPPGSLGELERVGVRLAGLAGVCPPPVPDRAAVTVFAADHGVYAQGVTPWPQEVTAQMVANLLAGGAAVNVLARQVGATVAVVDVGVAADLPAADGLRDAKVRKGTRDMTVEPAMTRDEALAAIKVGISAARTAMDKGARCLVTGDMGIANTTASAALIAAFTGTEPAAVTGRGTGIDDATLTRKVGVVQAALTRHRPDPADPLRTLAAVGGLEHAALVGYLWAGAAGRVPVLLDGVIAGAAALAARAFAPQLTAALFAGHRSAEPGASVALAALGLTPLLDLGLRLGEGTGAVLAVPLMQSAAAVLSEMATFSGAAVAQA